LENFLKHAAGTKLDAAETAREVLLPPDSRNLRIVYE
jgi:hypothetical protein